ncbi:acyl-CoA thioester hydrolase/BAAT C-terminal domain-containing protein [Pseudidiomarina sp.]|uniref:acyl-CoA thioester hydrolase/BAAT C-terminal domain-containing protein n=1 Tax=Pseudidiomarina sp. TaxID=2081707 RepID=UPI003A97799F
MKKLITPVVLVGLLAACNEAPAPDLHKNYILDDQAHPLVVLLGGSDGGNYFAAPQMQPLLKRYHDYGFSVASLGYFGTENTPGKPRELPLEAINQRIAALARDPAVKDQCVVLLGFSKGAELALLLGSHFDTANHIVAAFPSHVAWNAVKSPTSQSGWRLNGEPLAYIDAPLVSFDMLSGMITGEYVDAFNAALAKASPAEIDAARIPVEQIQGSVTLVSSKQDQIWPSYDMALHIEEHLQQRAYPKPTLHIALAGDHYSYDRETMHKVLSHLKDVMGSDCE